MSGRIKEIKKELDKRFLGWLGISSLAPSASQEEKDMYYQKLMQRFTRKVLWRVLGILPICALVLWLGIWIGKPSTPLDHEEHAGHSSSSTAEIDMTKEYWSCSMHPNIKLPTQGKCPVCFMDLILVKVGDSVFSLSETGKKLAEVEIAPALYRQVSSQVRMVGKVDYDETRVINITLWTPGRSRVHKMFVNFTGALVKKGEPLVEVYSPDMIAAQGEYISAYQTWRARNKNRDNLAITGNVKAARRKLLDLGMAKRQISALERTGRPDEVLTIFSPVSGTVTAKLTNEGEWHNRGMSLYQIADLSKVWVRLDAYESDLSFIRYAQQINFTAEAYPGRQFFGRIAFIDPFLNETTRTVKVRVNADNPDGRLKPGMFVRAIAKVQIGENGKVWEPSLVGKWVCPVHPEIIRDQPEECGTFLSLAKKTRCPKWLVLASPSSKTMLRSRVLTIPYTAPLVTGKRAIVYVEEKKQGESGIKFRYLTKDVQLGIRTGDYYVVLNGLEEGEQVVINGAFKIDSALQIKAKPSMMNPEGEQKPAKKHDKHQQHTKTKIPPFAIADADYHSRLQPMLSAYFDLAEDLAADKVDKVEEYLKRIRKALESISLETMGLPGTSRKQLSKNVHDLRQALEKFSRTDVERFRTALGKISVAQLEMPDAERKQLKKDIVDLRGALEKFVSTDIEEVRKNLLLLSQQLTIYLENFGHRLSTPIYKMYCPMVDNNKGAHWWQRHPKLKNAYFGSQMLLCGDVQNKLMPLVEGSKGHLTHVATSQIDLGNSYRTLFPKFINNYLAIGNSLVEDDLEGIGAQRREMLQILEKIYADTITKIKGQSKKVFHERQLYLKQMLTEMHGDNIKQLRRDYFDISKGMLRLVKNFGLPYTHALYLMYCPMYRHNLGGSWFQEQRAPLNNPYFGKDSSMYRCGELIETIPPMEDKQKGDTDGRK